MQNLKQIIKQRAHEAGRQVNDALHILENQKEIELELNSDRLEGKTAVKIVNSQDSIFRIVPIQGKKKLTKVFVNSCKGCSIYLDETILTQHLELIHCEDMDLFINTKLYTLQLDLCKNISVNYAEKVLCQDTRIIHAGVIALQIQSEDGHRANETYLDLIQMELNKVSEEVEVSAEERQFITSLEGDELTTRRIIKRAGHLIPGHI